MARSTLLALLLSTCAVALSAVAVLLLGPPLRRDPAPVQGDLDPVRLPESWTDLDRRLATLEEQAGRMEGSPSAAPDLVDPEEDASGIDDSSVEGRLARLEARLAVLEERVDAQGRDPIENSFAYLASESPVLRREGIRMLRKIARTDRAAREAIEAMLQDPDAKVREQALDVLADAGSPDSVPGILRLLGDSESKIRSDAIDALRRMLGALDPADPRMQALSDPLIARLADADVKVRVDAAQALGSLKMAGSSPALLKALEDPDARVREEAVVALGRLGDPAAAAALRPIHSQGPSDLAFPVALALQRMGDSQPFQQEVAKLLELATSAESEAERARAITTLSKHAPEQGKDVFQQALNDPSSRVRDAAGQALER